MQVVLHLQHLLRSLELVIDSLKVEYILDDAPINQADPIYMKFLNQLIYY